MSILNDFKRAWNNLLFMDEWMSNSPLRERMESYDLRYQYYEGGHRKQLRVKPGQADDNTAANFTGLVVDRSVSMLLGGGVEFDTDNEAAKEFLDEVFEANKKSILLKSAAQDASITGTGYIKILPNGAESRRNDGKMVTRLVALDPRQLEIVTHPEDIETVERYIVRFTFRDPITDKDRARRETTERQYQAIEDAPGHIIGFETTGWKITNEITNESGKWEKMSQVLWPYEFPPILHWKNLPQPGSVYGASDIEDVIELQDRWNFVVSNINRIIRYHAHPKGIGIGFSIQNLEKDASADSFWTIPGKRSEVDVYNLEMQSDLVSSREFANDLRAALFDTSRTVDLASFKDKIGQLTNFALRVLFFDSLSKLDDKRDLFGEALTELCHRLLVLGSITPGWGVTPVFQDPLPENDTEAVAGLTFELMNGLVSKETAAKERGRDWEQEKERIGKEQEAEQARSNFGSSLLEREFNAGRGGGQFGNQQ